MDSTPDRKRLLDLVGRARTGEISRTTPSGCRSAVREHRPGYGMFRLKVQP